MAPTRKIPTHSRRNDTSTGLYPLRLLADILNADRNRLAEQVRGLGLFPRPNRSRLYSLSAGQALLGDERDMARLYKTLAELFEPRLHRECRRVHLRSSRSEEGAKLYLATFNFFLAV